MRDDPSEGDIQPGEDQPGDDQPELDLRPRHLLFVEAAARAGTLLRYEELAGGRRVRIKLKGARFSDLATRDAYVAAVWNEMVEDEELETVPRRTVAKRIADLVDVIRAEHPEHLPEPDNRDRVEKDRAVVKKILQHLGKIPG